MTGLIYDCGHTERWANFTGDYNPVHFDLKAAELNQPALIAHGMRVLADIQNLLLMQGGYTFLQYPPLIRFSAKFEKPVLCGTRYSLLSQNGDNKTTFKLLDPLTGSVCIRGYAAHAVYPETRGFIASNPLTGQFQDEVLRRWPAEIEKNYATFLSSVMFRALFSTRELFTVNFSHDDFPVRSLPELLFLKKVLQTHYDLYCSPSLMLRKTWRAENLYICVENPFITGDDSYGWIIQVQVVAKENESIQMQTSVTLKISNKEVV
ncbi:hypothetical protein SME41J_48430 (plasmid) [Serratia marcescens]|nr:hypothetical protein SME41J_48430 [Serratia marcescens]